MKRCLALLLAIVILLLPCGIPVNAEGTLSENSKSMITFIKDKNNSLLIVRTNYAYMKLGAKWHSDVGVNYCLQMADLLIDTGSSPDKEKYMEVLINIISTYDMDNAADISSQKKQDNLKSIKDYGMDIAKMGGDAVSVYTKLKGIKGELSNIEEVLSKAIDGVGVLADNTNNWLEALTNLETFTQDFSNYNSFLKCIEENSDAELKDAAYTLRNSLKKSFLLKLEAYSKVSSDNFNNYTFFFFDDVFFDAAKAVSEYETDDAYKFIINSSEGAWERFFILKGSWDLGKDIGKLVGNIVVGGEDLINRTLEIEALYDISVILQDKVSDATNEFLTHSIDSDADNYIDEYITYANFLIGCRIRGEYCVYTILAEDAGLLSLLSDKKDAQNWYDDQSSAIIRLKNRVNGIKVTKAMPDSESSIGIDIEDETNHLQEYYNNMEKSGDSRETLDSDGDFYRDFSWKINDYKIKDYNGDGHSELVVQYSVKQQGIEYAEGKKLVIISYEDGEYKQYQYTDGFMEYITPAGGEPVGNYDELFVDDNNNLSIFHVHTMVGLTIVNTISTCCINNGKTEKKYMWSVFYSTDIYAYYSGEYDDSGILYCIDNIDTDHPAFSIISFCEYKDFTNDSGKQIDLNTAKDYCNKTVNVNFVDDFRVLWNEQHEDESLDITKWNFYSKDEFYSKYLKNNPDLAKYW